MAGGEVAFVFGLLLLSCAPGALLLVADAKMVSIQNNAIRVGVDTEQGGAISEFIDLNVPSVNLINNHDKGRLVQQSYYAGPDPYRGAKWSGHPWPWNPISAGDAFGHHSTVLEATTRKNGTELYVKAIPLQWALDNVPCNCTFETLISLDANGFYVRNRLTNNRADHTAYHVMNQETPAVYVVGTLFNLWTYDGAEPFKGKNLTNVAYPIPGPPWKSFRATENWAAFTDSHAQKYGVGVSHAKIDQFLGGFAGTRGQGGPLSPNTGYIAPITNKAIRWDEEWTWCFRMALGYLDTIRGYLNEHRTHDVEHCSF